MTTPLYPTFQKRISDVFEQLMKNQVTPWHFLNAGEPMRVKKHDGNQISYGGVRFEGSPEHVFWSRYIEPFMEEICINEIVLAVKMATERGVSATLLLPEVKGLLLSGIRKTYAEMAKTDQSLRGRGCPDKIPLRSIEKEFDNMKHFIEVRVKAELDMWKPKSKLESWYEKNKSLVWLIGTILAIGGLIANFL